MSVSLKVEQVTKVNLCIILQVIVFLYSLKIKQVTKVDLCIIFFYFDERNEINITFKAKKHTFKNTLIIAFA